MPTVTRGMFSWLFQGVAVLEDFADRLSHVWTTGLLLTLAAIVSWRQEVHKPISCVTPNEFTDALSEYTHETCWASSKNLHLPLDQPIPLESDARLEFYSWKYKWFPVVLVIQALLFKFPNVVMHVFHAYSGISFEKIAGFTRGFQNMNLADRSQLGRQIGQYLHLWCRQWGCFLPWRGMTIIWFIVKVLFCANSLTQLVLVDKFLRNPFDNTTSYGDTIYNNLFNKSAIEWRESPVFPRTILCEFDIKKFNNVERYMVQCVLPSNVFNEYVYMLVWLWLLVVCVATWISFVVWMIRTLAPVPRQRYISKMLSLAGQESQQMRHSADTFAGLVGEDGVNVLKLVSANSSELLVRDAVWTMFVMSQQQPPYNYTTVTTQLPTTAPQAGANLEVQPQNVAATTNMQQEKLLHVS